VLLTSVSSDTRYVSVEPRLVEPSFAVPASGLTQSRMIWEHNTHSRKFNNSSPFLKAFRCVRTRFLLGPNAS
jgi:hypothetical protein